MAYQTGTASSLSDFVSQLFTFLTGNGWTQDQLDTGAGEAAIHKGNVFVSFRWNTTTPLHLAIYHALGFNVGVSTATIAGGGTAYTVGDILTISGGTKTTAGTLKVMAVSSGVITSVRVETAGINYTVNPSNPVSVTGGTGSGATFNLTYTGTASGDPGQHCDDSGNGIVDSANVNLATSRNLHNIGNGPYPAYHFFLDTDYFHGVLEYSSGLFRHFGFGTLEKFGDWHGGEYCYGHSHVVSTPTSGSNTILLDGLFTDSSSNNEQRGATIHLQSLPNMLSTTKWGICWNNSSGGFTTDRAGNVKVRTPGGFRGNTIGRAFGWIRSNVSNGFMPMVPIPAYYHDVSVTPTEAYLLGHMKDVRSLNMAPFDPGEEITIGADTWVVFPTVRKQFTGVTDESRNQGIAYKKIP